MGLGQSEQGEESGNQLTAGLGAAELALGAIHPRLRQRSDPFQSSFAKGHAGGSVPKCAKGGNRKSSWEAAAEIRGDTPIPPDQGAGCGHAEKQSIFEDSVLDVGCRERMSQG